MERVQVRPCAFSWNGETHKRHGVVPHFVCIRPGPLRFVKRSVDVRVVA